MTDPRFIPPSNRVPVNERCPGVQCYGSSSTYREMYNEALDHAAFMDERVAELEAERDEWSLRYEQMRKRVQQEIAEALNAKGERDSNRTMRWFAEAQAKLSQAKLFEADERDARQRDLIRDLGNTVEACEQVIEVGKANETRQRDLIRRLAEALAIEGDSECGTKEEVCILLAEARGIEAPNE